MDLSHRRGRMTLSHQLPGRGGGASASVEELLAAISKVDTTEFSLVLRGVFCGFRAFFGIFGRKVDFSKTGFPRNASNFQF
jgi:hypothetical protein